MSNPPPPSTTTTTTTTNHPSSSDPTFRKTWDRSTYAALAAAREQDEKANAKARYEAKQQGRKYHPPSNNDNKNSASQTETLSRTARLDVSAHVGKTMLVPAGAGATGKRGRGAGFYCEECDLTFKDNLQFVDHLNSRQHLVATGQSGLVKKATVAEVRERLDWLVARKKQKEMEEGGKGEVDLGKRLEERRVEEERVKEERRKRRNEKRRKNKDGGVKVEEGFEGGGGIIC